MNGPDPAAPGRQAGGGLLVLLCLLLAAVVTGTSLYAGLGARHPLPPPDPTGAVRTAMDRLAGLSAARYTGSYFDQTRGTVGLDVTVTDGGELSGDLTLQGREGAIRGSAKGLFLRGDLDFWLVVEPGMSDVLGDSWVNAPADLLDVDLTSVLRPATFAKSMSCVDNGAAGGFELTGSDPTVVAGVTAYSMSSAECGTVHLSAVNRYRVARAISPTLTPASTRDNPLAGFVLDPSEVSADRAGKVADEVAAAAKEAGSGPDPSEPESLPPFYVAEGVDVSSCDPAACTIELTVHNMYGEGDTGTLVGNVVVQGAGTAALGNCQVSIPALEYQESTPVTCTVTGPDWTQVATAAVTDPARVVIGGVQVVNPDWEEGGEAALEGLSELPELTLLSDIWTTFGVTGLNILYASLTSSTPLIEEQVDSMLTDAQLCGCIGYVRDLVESGQLGNLQDLPAVLSVAVRDFPRSMTGVAALAEAARRVEEGGGPVEVYPGVANVVDDAAKEAVVVSAQLEPDGEAVRDLVKGTFDGLVSETLPALPGYTPVVSLTVEPYYPALHDPGKADAVLAVLSEIGIAAADFAPDGILEIRTGTHTFRFTAADFG